MVKYFTFSLSIAFISWIVGMVINAFLAKTTFYQKRLSNLNFVRSEQINRWLGLAPFKWIIMHSFFKFFNPKLSIKKTILAKELTGYRLEMTTAELNHLFAFSFMTVFLFIKIVQGQYLFALIMLLVNVLMNLYPSLLQQQNKRRIDRYLEVLKKRSA
ncbi:hypothetical protein ACFSR6_18740 [Pedobacter vanadiisoli]|uniref:Glycosyl-4,4'-diaponeurosporenoate acyltransferase n=1 Tax=Pedobacter vanadiisoli TaxID=1761975 RepID=A0ABW5MN40_9SPHI